jgi:outer membrane protein assembly factor BamB
VRWLAPFLAGLAAASILVASGCGDSDDDSASAGGAGSADGGKIEDWPMFGRVSARTHYLDKPGIGPPGKQIWQFDDPTLLEFPPVLYKERLYLADKAGDVRALDATNGKVIWNRQRVNSQGRGSVPADVTAPTFAGDVLVVAFEPGEVIALEPAEGKLEWSTHLPSTLQSSPVAVDNRVYLGSDDGTLWGLSLDNGKQQSVFRAEQSIKASPSLDDGKLFFGDYAGNMYALDESSGKLLWKTDTTTTPAGGSGGFFSSPAIAGGRVYAGRDDGTIFAFDADTGKYSWSYKTGGAVYGSPALAPIPGGGLTVFIGSYDAKLYALDAGSGKVTWSEAVGPIPGTATVINETVYTSSFKTGNTVGYDLKSHDRVFRYPSPGYTPMISDGVRLFLAGYQSVHSFEPK